MAHHPKKPTAPKPTTKEKLQAIKKASKQKLKEKRARLIIKNLPFESTEENIKEHFSKFGQVDHVELLKKEDGLLKGCGFVQFKLVQKAAKAKHHTNGKPFLGRDIIVDFAVAKNKFSNKIKQENDVKVKEEPLDDEIKPENASEDDSDVEIKDVPQSKDEESSDSSNEESSDEEKPEIKEEPKPTKFESNDITEGRTIFVKNVPFQATNEDLKQCMRQFGPIFYALICVDKFTEHSKGTAFVKFQQVADAEKALSAGTELTLLGNVLDCHKALGRNEIQNKAAQKTADKTAPKDSRNLYLVKEGVILAGSKAAESVSASDMAKRLQLEQYKTQMLRNLNMFVSRDRLIVHNVPASWDDSKLRSLFLRHSPKNAQIREVKIMRDIKNCDEKGVGRSKEYGFVSYNRHEDALHALRSLNNNPNVFSAGKRPIVAFSIENKSMIKAKLKRLEKSRAKNPLCRDFDSNLKKKDDEKRKRGIESNDAANNSYTGVTARPGVQKMRSRYNLKTQAQLHHENLKREKKKQKFSKKSLAQKKEEFTKQGKQKIKGGNAEKDDFSKMVAEYKKKLTAPVAKKSKWYEEAT